MSHNNYIDLFLNKEFRAQLIATYETNKIDRSFDVNEINSQLRELFAWITSQVNKQKLYSNRKPSFDSIKPKELARCILEIANMGLSINPYDKEAYLFIHWESHCEQVFPTVKIGIQGMNQFYGACSKIKSTNFSVVHDGDQFEWYGENTPPRFIHSYTTDGNAIVAAFSVITFTDGTFYCSYIGTSEIQSIISDKTHMADDAGISAWVNFTSRCVRNVILRRTFNSLANILGLLPNNRSINDSGVVVKVEQQTPNVPQTTSLTEESVSDEDFAALLANQLEQ
tara:strand:+ start:6303 stop:7151 length:849 start_codon:yes stop_codon:yes gene_type:complete